MFQQNHPLRAGPAGMMQPTVRKGAAGGWRDKQTATSRRLGLLASSAAVLAIGLAVTAGSGWG